MALVDAAVKRVIQAAGEFEGSVHSYLVGVPWYEPVQALREAFSSAARADSHAYGPHQGIEPLRQYIAAKCSEEGMQIGSDNVVFGNGSKSLLAGLLRIIDRPVVIPLPNYPGALTLAKITGSRLLTFTTDACRTFRPQDIDKAEFDRSVLFVSSPCNPTGLSVKPEDASAIIDICRLRDMLLIVDECYLPLQQQAVPQPWGRFDPECERLVLLRSYSKSLGICGWRAGYAVCNSRLADLLAYWQGATMNPPSTLVQHGLHAYLVDENCHYVDVPGISQRATELQNTADAVCLHLSFAGLQPIRPDGGLYVCIDISRSTGASSVDFAVSLARKTGLIIWPGEDFGRPGLVRIVHGSIAPDKRDEQIDSIAAAFSAVLKAERN